MSEFRKALEALELMTGRKIDPEQVRTYAEKIPTEEGQTPEQRAEQLREALQQLEIFYGSAVWVWFDLVLDMLKQEAKEVGALRDACRRWNRRPEDQRGGGDQ